MLQPTTGPVRKCAIDTEKASHRAVVRMDFGRRQVPFAIAFKLMVLAISISARPAVARNHANDDGQRVMMQISGFVATPASWFRDSMQRCAD
jgi:hypothetical protein